MPLPSAYRVADLPQNAPTLFDLSPDATERETLAKELDIKGIRKLRFEGTLKAQGKKDWVLKAKLGATVVQPCVVTLEPVATRIDVPVTRVFLAEWDTPETAEVEMHEDDTKEPLGTYIDTAAIMAEALSLALPLYPRKDGAAVESTVFAEPGVKPMTDEDARPFAGLAGLRDTLKNKD